MGDFNIDLLKSSKNHVLDFVNLTNCFGLRNLINKPTRVTKETHTLLDHIYTNDSKYRIYSGMCLWDTSDHYPIFCVVSLSKSFHRAAKVTFRDTQQFSIENFLSELQIPLSNMPSSEDVNSSLSTLLASFENVLNKHAPLKTLSKLQERIKSKPWLTKGLLRSIRTKNKLFTNLHKKSVQDDHKWAKFRKYRNKLNHLIEKSKVNYYMQQIASSNNNSSLMWETIKTY